MLCLGAAAPAHAQAAPEGGLADTEPAAATAPDVTGGATSGSTQVPNDIVVTASRVQANGFSAPTPTTVLGAAQIQSTAPAVVSEALALIPSFRTTGQPASATTYADLRGIGAQRTLVLVNGRRHVPTFSDGTVDLGVIPAILIARTEVVTGGASASWGSDAVAGVINLILKQDIDGIQGNAQYGLSERGDGINYLGSLAAGTTFADGRGHILVGGEYSRDKGIRSLQQPYRSRPWSGRGSVGNSAFATNGLPGTIYTEDARRADVSNGGLITSGPLRGTTFLPNGATGTFGYGQVFGNNMIGGTDNAGDAPTPGGDLKFPFERYTIMGRASFDFSDALTVFAEGTYASVLSTGLAQPARNNGAVTGNPTCTTTSLASSLGSILVPINNPYLPAAVRQRMAAAGVSCVNVGRVFRDPGMGDFRVDDGSPSIFRGVIGAEGKLIANWKWEGYYQYGRNHFEQKRIGNINVGNFRRAIDAVATPGGIACRVNADASTANDDAACRPFNLFGDGSPSQESIRYVTGTSSFRMITKQQVASLSANGDLFSTWAGPIGAATGVEYRKEEIDAVADPISEANGWQTSNRKAIRGDYDVKEIFGELVIPLAKDWSFAKSFDLNLAARYTDYSSSGGVTTWKAGATWDVTSDIRLRATKSRDIRAGNLGELFTPTAVLTTNVRDPRNSSVIPVPVTTTGNRSLSPERADTFTGGIVYQPSWFEGFRASVDYYNIKIDGQIGTIPANEVLERCFLDNLQQFCALVTTGANGALTNVTVQFENLDKFRTSGLDIETSYRAPVERLFGGGTGDIFVRVLANYVDKLATTAAVNATTTDPAGQYTNPHWSVFGLVSYEGKRFGTALDLRWFGGGTIDNTRVEGLAAVNGVNINDVDPILYTNATLTMDVSPNADKRMELYFRVNNLFDKAPSFPNTAEARTIFDPVGRAYRVGMRFRL
jgi:outer membrane receptor protein involved in Fe transport